MASSVEPPMYHDDFCKLDDPAEDLRIFKLTMTSGPEIEGQILRLPVGKEYVALSWCWGPRDSPTRMMRITHKDQPYSFRITVSLESALKELRRHRVEYLWIDQICMQHS